MITTIIKRNGMSVPFDPTKIVIVMKKAFAAEQVPVDDDALEQMTGRVVVSLGTLCDGKENCPTVEQVQDLVENTLMERGYFSVAKAYILYRFQQSEERKQEVVKEIEEQRLTIERTDGSIEQFSREKMREYLQEFTEGYAGDIDFDDFVSQIEREVYDGIKTSEMAKLVTLVLRSRIENDPAYSIVAARQLCRRISDEVVGNLSAIPKAERVAAYRNAFVRNIKRGAEAKKYDSVLLSYDLEKLSASIEPGRDDLFKYIGIETLNDRYFVRIDGKKLIETPQMMWMRIAMGLALNEKNKEERAVEFYNIMSLMHFIPSTPTLFHAGTPHPQLSSCYLNVVEDDLTHIFKVYGDNAMLSKWAGGIGTAWSKLRGTGALIKAAGITSQGVIPFLKIANDVTVAINRSGRRRGATAVYMENWHIDFEDFLELRKNTGDERRRTHDMNTAAWISDLFMKRVREDGQWTLFSPDEAADLTETYGKQFDELYEKYEGMADVGEIKLFKRVKARDLWRRMLGMLFETGHPWITFKDPSNIRSPQDHAGVIHSSNLCTEITLNTSAEETAVCNLGSVNFPRHIINGVFDEQMVKQTVTTAMRMLDNVIDLNFYPTVEARNSNMKHRPVGLGIMGFQDALYMQNIPFGSDACVEFSDASMEIISYYAILASTELARERGMYQSYKGSKWDRGIFPVDTIALLEDERGISTGTDCTERLDWGVVRDAVKQYGMRNSNTMAIAPTATIANIAGSIPGNEPIYKNIYVKSNISGDFVIVNSYLVEDLKKDGLWDDEMLQAIKYNDGSLADIPSVPVELKVKYKETFEIDMRWLVKAGASRGKWIDQSQSLNIFFNGTSGKELSELYMYAWEAGLKTTYYLRSLAATQVEKSTVGNEGTHLRKDSDAGRTPDAAFNTAVIPGTAFVRKETSSVPVAQTTDPIPSPMPTPSPFTKGIREKEKVELKNKSAVKLHIAEDAICESCQ
ncbi:MAG: ribonucleoside-diphosphate reductase subunit alpha [Candidatus Pacebacteria bacterium]|nr:ribonucleoside-diphosphate reductase subunit alpha [Candidatus Paceibacterota bacterium]MCF7856853.1 ribonucleoside-diphosphate reductase subunit alpha [Candidatus Paceibacterota bacterium]